MRRTSGAQPCDGRTSRTVRPKAVFRGVFALRRRGATGFGKSAVRKRTPPEGARTAAPGGSALQACPIPAAEIRGRGVGRLEERAQRIGRRRRAPGVVV